MKEKQPDITWSSPGSECVTDPMNVKQVDAEKGGERGQ